MARLEDEIERLAAARRVTAVDAQPGRSTAGAREALLDLVGIADGPLLLERARPGGGA